MRQEIAKLVSGSSFIFGCRVAGAIIVFLTHIYLARWMGAEQLGYYVYAFALVVLLSTIAGVGFPAASLRVIGQGLADNDLARIRGFIEYGWQVTLLASLVLGGGEDHHLYRVVERRPTGLLDRHAIRGRCHRCEVGEDLWIGNELVIGADFVSENFGRCRDVGADRERHADT